MKTKIVIHTDGDFTPAGKRTLRLVRLSARHRYATAKGVQVIRWYVSGKIYNTLAVTPENAALSNEWVAA